MTLGVWILDALQLDEELISMIKNEIFAAFKYLNVAFSLIPTAYHL